MAAGEAINCEKRHSSPVPGETFSHVGSDTACPEQLPTLPPFLEDFRTPLDTVLSKLGLNSEPTLLRVPFQPELHPLRSSDDNRAVSFLSYPAFRRQKGGLFLAEATCSTTLRLATQWHCEIHLFLAEKQTSHYFSTHKSIT